MTGIKTPSYLLTYSTRGHPLSMTLFLLSGKKQYVLKRSHSCLSQYRSHFCCDSVVSDIAPAPAPRHHTTPTVPSSHPHPLSLTLWDLGPLGYLSGDNSESSKCNERAHNSQEIKNNSTCRKRQRTRQAFGEVVLVRQADSAVPEGIERTTNTTLDPHSSGAV